MKKWLLISNILSVLCLHGVTLVPNAPVQVSFAGNSLASTQVAGIGQTYMAVWSCGSSVCFSVTQDNGNTWTTPSPVTGIDSPSANPWVAVNSTGFLVTCVDVPPGATPGALVSAFTSNLGTSWTNGTIQAGSSTNPPGPVIGTSSGFLANWFATDGTIFSSFSSDGVSWSSPSVVVDPGGDSGVTSISAGTKSTFLTSWSDSSGDGFVSYTTDSGSHWTAPLQIDTGPSVDGIMLWSAQNTLGTFLVTWQSGSNDAYSSFSSDNGNTWSSPLLIATDISTSHYDAVTCTNTSENFIVGTHCIDDTGRVSISTDSGSTWAPFVTVTGDHPMDSGTIYNNFLALASGSDGIMTVWVDATFNIFSAFIPLTPEPSILPPSNLSGLSLNNRLPFQSQAYNTLSWSASPTSGVTGYLVYRNGALLTTTPALSFTDFTIVRGQTYVYEVAATNGSGENSSTVSVSVSVP